MSVNLAHIQRLNTRLYSYKYGIQIVLHNTVYVLAYVSRVRVVTAIFAVNHKEIIDEIQLHASTTMLTEMALSVSLEHQ